ncbi:hypothetical protein [Pseudorhodobacter sp.]|uniref:capsular polysaccharide export protein, LipB/KpsS family n=1 Tax=Pseudorhodobacter sp. TaxID=1934400 RepID=UPI002648429F|nr:hypothetical protein [Pseudorhodobacter sp.]MDN5787315.1 hypothetical protein [Pseudorhodobacter sp.]
MSGFVFHLPTAVLRGSDALKPYYTRLTEGLASRGFAVRLVPHERETLLATVAADDDFHIVDHGAERHSRVLNTGIAYVYPFWNLDPWGIRALSSLAEKPFDHKKIDMEAAADFANRLRKRWMHTRKSRYEQPRRTIAVPTGCIAVFLQSESHRDLMETCHLTLRQMVKALLVRDDPRAIVIKPHPLDPDPATLRFLARIADRDARVRITQGNIHDILAAASICVTINSAVGVEAMMHGVPVVLCGKSDFHHCAVTVQTSEGMAAGIAQAEATDWPHDAFLYWYFGLNCLNAGKPRLVDDFLERVAAAGFVPS